MHHRYALAFLALLLPAAAPAQFTITADDIRGRFNTAQTHTYHYVEDLPAAQAQALINVAGAGQTWDLTGITFSDEETFTVRIASPVTDVAGADRFPEANYAIVDEVREDSSWAAFFEIRDDATYALGFYAVSGGQTFEQVFDPPLFGGPLPIAFGSTWTDTSSFTLRMEGVNIVTSTVDAAATVDSYGTLITPDGSFETLRIAEQQNLATSVGGQTLNTMSYDYSWVTRDAREGATLTRSVPAFGPETYELQYVTVGEASGVSTEREVVPPSFTLDASYPNPFNPATTIGFTLTQPSHVRLTVHTLLGQRVAVLVDRPLPAGAHEVTFEAADLPSGLYLYRLAADGAERTRTMTLMR